MNYESEPPDGAATTPEGFNAVTVLAMDHNGVWLPALTVKVDTDLIKPEVFRQPIRFCVVAEAVRFPE